MDMYSYQARDKFKALVNRKRFSNKNAVINLTIKPGLENGNLLMLSIYRNDEELLIRGIKESVWLSVGLVNRGKVLGGGTTKSGYCSIDALGYAKWGKYIEYRQLNWESRKIKVMEMVETWISKLQEKQKTTEQIAQTTKLLDMYNRRNQATLEDKFWLSNFELHDVEQEVERVHAFRGSDGLYYIEGIMRDGTFKSAIDHGDLEWMATKDPPWIVHDSNHFEIYQGGFITDQSVSAVVQAITTGLKSRYV